MSSVSRSVKNVFRNKARTLVVILIIGLSIGVFLSMSVVNANIAENTTSLSEGMDTTITITPAGSMIPMSTDMMNESVIDQIETVEHIETIQKLSLVIESSGDSRRGTPIQGIDPSISVFLFSGGSIGDIISGRTLDSGDVNQSVAIIGIEYSNDNDINVGDSIVMNETSVEVIGVFDSGTRLGGNTIIMPYEALKSAYSLDGPNIIYVTVDTIGNMGIVEEELKDTLGTEDYDVAPLSALMGDRADAIQENIDSIAVNSELGSLVSLITAAAVMVFVMILVTRERIREIGVLKAIGFRNSRIMSQFFTESMALATIGFVVGVLLTIIAGPNIANLFIGASSTSSAPGTSMSLGDFTLSSELMLYTLALAIVLGILGSLYPIMKAINLKPAEALRYDE